MLPTLAAPGSPEPEDQDVFSAVSRGSRHAALNPALTALDEWLFSPTEWHALGAASNETLPIAIPSLEAGLELLGKGKLTAFFGRLRDGALAIDIDQRGPFGYLIRDEIVDWLHRNDIWHLVRPSGGADGRFHVFTAPGPRCDEVKAFVLAKRDELGLTHNDLNARTPVRPLSSPHRSGVITQPHGDLRDALRRLKRVFPDAPELVLGRPRKKAPAKHRPATPTDVAALTLQRHKRQLAPQWRRYLLTGDTAALGAYRPVDGTQSLPELGLTRELVWAIGDPDIAWQLIREAHPTAMVKARSRGRDWWTTYVWNPSVEGAEAFSPTPARQSVPPAAEKVAAAVEAARQLLVDLMWTQTPRSRPSLLLVGHHLLDRMLTAGSLRVPCPERDLVKSTGIADRKTIRAALRLMNGSVGTLHTDCLSYLERDSTSFEFEIAPVEICSEIPPLRFHTPPAPRGLWATLPRAAHGLWRTLLASDAQLTLEELAVKAGLVDDQHSTPTRSHLAAAKKAAIALAHAGLARVDENGRWYAGTSPRSVRVEQRAQAAYAVLADQVEAERAAYREGAASSWTAQRARALKAQKAKEKAWWASLPPAERGARRQLWSSKFDELSITKQAQIKAKLAASRIKAGIDELQHHQAWLNSLSPDEFLHRSLERRKRFRAMSNEERGLAVATWARHRATFGLPSPAPAVSDDTRLWPDTSAERDQLFLERQLALPLPPANNVREAG